DDAGDGASELRAGNCGADTNPKCSWKFSVLLERLGSKHFGLGANARGGERQQDLRGGFTVEQSSPFGASGSGGSADGHIWSAGGGGRLRAIVWDPGRSATWAVGLQNYRCQRRSV